MRPSPWHLVLTGCWGSCNLGAFTLTYTILGVPYYNCSLMGPQTLLKLLSPLYKQLGDPFVPVPALAVDLLPIVKRPPS